MKHRLILLLVTITVNFFYSSCSKHEQIIIEPNGNQPTKDTAKKMFIGVHTRTVTYPTVYDLIVGYTYSDNSFVRTDSIRGPFYANPNMDKHTSTMSISKKTMYFIYKHATNNNLMIGTIDVTTGKYIKSIDIGLAQTDMIHLLYDEQGSKLYFSMGQSIYEVDETSGALNNVNQQQSAIMLPSDYSAGAGYLSFLLNPKYFYYIKDNSKFMYFDRNTLKWDSITLPGSSSSSYRSLVVSPADENIFYSYNLIGNTIYNLVKIDLNKKTATSSVTQNSFCHILWFQARLHPANKLYSCLPFEHQMFPYFITIDTENGTTKKYLSPSVMGQCLLD